MSRFLLSLTGSLALALGAAGAASAQDQTTQQPTQTTTVTQTTQAVQNADGSWTVIQYPANKETVVDFTPGPNYTNATGRARVMRMGDHTMINLDLSGLPADATGFNLYAVDPMGKVTLVGPVNISNGAATQQFTTPLDRFMLVLSPEANLTTYGPTTSYAFRSAIPQGFAVVPLASHGEHDGAPVGERVSATSTPGTTPASPYAVPMLNIPGFRRGTDTHMKVNFSGAMTGARANVFIEPRKDGPTQVKMRFHDLKNAPASQVYILWAVGADNKFVKLGQIVNTGRRNETEIKSETALADFGLLVTMEPVNGTYTNPSGPVVGTVVIDHQ